jgi:Fe-S-cluster-containing hydrogenase component 2
MRIDDHPTVRAVRSRPQPPPDDTVLDDTVLDADWVRATVSAAGADDVGIASIDAPGLAREREHILAALPGARSVIVFCCRLARTNTRSVARSVANQEFHTTTDDVNEIARKITFALEDRGIGAVNPAASFPQEMDRFPGRLWVLSYKDVAVAAGLGQIGIHRNVIHPRFGNFIILGAIITQAEISSYDRPIDFNPCLECKLCVAACPVGAIDNDGGFDFFACYTHNYREFMSGFTDWAQTVADSDGAADYRSRVSDSESASMWQSLAFKPNYKAAYCMAVCPAGEDVILPYLADRKGFLKEIVRPLQHKEETIYAAHGSSTSSYVAKRFPHKTVKEVDNGLEPPQRRDEAGHSSPRQGAPPVGEAGAL